MNEYISEVRRRRFEQRKQEEGNKDESKGFSSQEGEYDKKVSKRKHHCDYDRMQKMMKQLDRKMIEKH